MPVHTVRLRFNNPELFAPRYGQLIDLMTEEGRNWFEEHVGKFKEPSSFPMSGPLPEVAPGEWLIANSAVLGEPLTNVTQTVYVHMNCEDTVAVLCKLRWG